MLYRSTGASQQSNGVRLTVIDCDVLLVELCLVCDDSIDRSDTWRVLTEQLDMWNDMTPQIDLV